jgi:hypothetical protein
MMIDETTWKELVAHVYVDMGRWTDRNIANGGTYRYTMEVDTHGEFKVLTTTQHQKSAYSEEPHTNRRRVAWRQTDGALMKVVAKRVGRNQLQWVGKPAPKKWATAFAKGNIGRLANAIGLDGFIEIGAAYFAGTSSLNDDGQVEHHQIIRGNDVKIVRENLDGTGWWRVTYNGDEHMGEIYQTLAEAEAKARDWCTKNPRDAAVGA